MSNTGDSFTGWAFCTRCGEQVAPHRKLCDVCRNVPDFMAVDDVDEKVLDDFYKKVRGEEI